MFSLFFRRWVQRSDPQRRAYTIHSGASGRLHRHVHQAPIRHTARAETIGSHLFAWRVQARCRCGYVEVGVWQRYKVGFDTGTRVTTIYLVACPRVFVVLVSWHIRAKKVCFLPEIAETFFAAQ